MKLTFKQYLVEQEIKKQMVYMAKDLLGAVDVETTNSIDDDETLDKAREISHKFVDSAAGKWVISIFKNAKDTFARIDPPKGVNGQPRDKQLYIFPKG